MPMDIHCISDELKVQYCIAKQKDFDHKSFLWVNKNHFILLLSLKS